MEGPSDSSQDVAHSLRRAPAPRAAGANGPQPSQPPQPTNSTSVKITCCTACKEPGRSFDTILWCNLCKKEPKNFVHSRCTPREQNIKGPWTCPSCKPPVKSLFRPPVKLLAPTHVPIRDRGTDYASPKLSEKASVRSSDVLSSTSNKEAMSRLPATYAKLTDERVDIPTLLIGKSKFIIEDHSRPQKKSSFINLRAVTTAAIGSRGSEAYLSLTYGNAEKLILCFNGHAVPEAALEAVRQNSRVNIRTLATPTPSLPTPLKRTPVDKDADPPHEVSQVHRNLTIPTSPRSTAMDSNNQRGPAQSPPAANSKRRRSYGTSGVITLSDDEESYGDNVTLRTLDNTPALGPRSRSAHASNLLPTPLSAVASDGANAMVHHITSDQAFPRNQPTQSGTQQSPSSPEAREPPAKKLKVAQPLGQVSLSLVTQIDPIVDRRSPAPISAGSISVEISGFDHDQNKSQGQSLAPTPSDSGITDEAAMAEIRKEVTGFLEKRGGYTQTPSLGSPSMHMREHSVMSHRSAGRTSAAPSASQRPTPDVEWGINRILRDDITKLNKTIEHLKADVDKKELENRRMKRQLNEAEHKAKMRRPAGPGVRPSAHDTDSAQLKNPLEEKKKQLDDANSALGSRDATIADLSRAKERLETELLRVNAELVKANSSEPDDEMDVVRQALQESQEAIDALSQRILELEEMPREPHIDLELDDQPVAFDQESAFAPAPAPVTATAAGRGPGPAPATVSMQNADDDPLGFELMCAQALTRGREKARPETRGESRDDGGTSTLQSTRTPTSTEDRLAAKTSQTSFDDIFMETSTNNAPSSRPPTIITRTPAMAWEFMRRRAHNEINATPVTKRARKLGTQSISEAIGFSVGDKVKPKNDRHIEKNDCLRSTDHIGVVVPRLDTTIEYPTIEDLGGDNEDDCDSTIEVRDESPQPARPESYQQPYAKRRPTNTESLAQFNKIAGLGERETFPVRDGHHLAMQEETGRSRGGRKHKDKTKPKYRVGG